MIGGEVKKDWKSPQRGGKLLISPVEGGKVE